MAGLDPAIHVFRTARFGPPGVEADMAWQWFYFIIK
jgi:hypothetical protein